MWAERSSPWALPEGVSRVTWSRSACIVNGRLRQIDVIGRPAPGADRPASHRSRSQHPISPRRRGTLPRRSPSGAQPCRMRVTWRSRPLMTAGHTAGAVSANTRLDGSWTIQIAQGGALRDHQVIAQPVVPPVCGGRDANPRRPHEAQVDVRRRRGAWLAWMRSTTRSTCGSSRAAPAASMATLRA